MSRYIDADALINRLDTDEYGMRLPKAVVGLTKVLLDDAPSIDIEPKRGEWVKRTHNTLIAQVNFAYCSECGQPIMHEHTRPLWNFCPNCGADMRGKDDERRTD